MSWLRQFTNISRHRNEDIKAEKNKRLSIFHNSLIASLFILLIFFILSIYIFLRAYEGLNSPYVFWFIWISTVLILIYIAFRFEVKYYLFGMIIFQLMMGIIWVFGQVSPLPTGTDAIFESQYAGTIVTTGKWDVNAGVGYAENYYGYAPLIHMNMAFTSMITGCDVFAIGKYFPFLERVLYFLIMFVVLRKLVGNKIAILSTFFIFSSPPLILIHTSRRLLAEPFLLLVLLCIFYQLVKTRNKSSQKYLILLPIFFISVILGHHMTFYFLIYFLIFILLAILISLFIQKIRYKKSFFKIEKTTKLGILFSILLVSILTILGILFLIYSGIFNFDLARLQAGIDTILSLEPSSAESTASGVGSGFDYPKIYVYLAFIFVGLFYLVLLFSLRYIKKLKNNFLVAWSIASALLLFVPVIALLSGTRVGRLFGTVGWGVGAIGMAVPAAKFIKNWWQKNRIQMQTILIVVIVLLYCGGILIAYPIQYYCSEDTEAINNDHSVHAGGWLQSQTETSEVIGGDRYSFDVVTGRFLRVMRYNLRDVYAAQSIDELTANITDYAESNSVEWFFINDVITKYPIISSEKIQKYKIEMFDDTPVLNKVYSVKQISIYIYRPMA